MRIIIIGTLLLGACAAGGGSNGVETRVTAAGASRLPEQPGSGPVFYSIGELSRPDNLNTELRGGRVADPAEWQASFYSLSADGACTSTLVGDRVLLTAAHCVADGAPVTLKRGDVTYRGVCEHAPEYHGGGQYARTADYALCALDAPVIGVAPERLNPDPSLVRVGTQVLLTGFGCTTNQGTGGNDGIYRIGDAHAVSVPSGANNDITVEGQAGLCFGDSGGPAFLQLAGGRRLVVSVNSRVQNNSHTGTDLGIQSYLSSTSTPIAIAFLRDWSRRNNLHICGLDSAATLCRA
jgi:hypothetical protein